MKVTFLRTGGLAGLRRGCVLEASRLSLTEAEELRALVNQAQISGAAQLLSPQGRDLQQYKITVEQDDERNELLVDDLIMPEKVRPLVQFLQARCGPVSQ